MMYLPNCPQKVQNWQAQALDQRIVFRVDMNYFTFLTKNYYITKMNLEQRLSLIFQQSFQINRLVKEIQNLKEAKPKLGLQVKYISRQNVQFVIIVEIVKWKLKQIKKLAFLDKIEIKIVLKNTYPTEPPSLYFLNQNSIELGINPFYNYLKSVCAEWTPKVSILDIVKLVPLFMVHSIQKPKEIHGQAAREFFQAQRLFSFQKCQIFPVKLIRNNSSIDGIIGIINEQQIILFQQSNFANTYLSCNIIKMQEIVSVQKHKSNYLKVLLQIKRNKSKFAVQFTSDQFQTIIGIIIEKIKLLAVDKENQESQQSQDDVKMPTKQKQNEDFFVNDSNIKEVQSQIIILQSLADNKPNSKNIKELVELLKKAVQYYSIKGDERSRIHLKTLQNIMNNQFLQTLLLSQQEKIQTKNNKIEYESITNYV